MIKNEFRSWLAENYPDTIILDNPSFDNAIIGISNNGCVIYDYEQMLIELCHDDNMTYADAIEWIDYNTLRSIPYMPEGRPIITMEIQYE